MGKDDIKQDDELATALAAVRKGKLRHFTIFAIGSDVLGLLITKKPNTGRIKEGRKAAKGSKAFSGWCKGKGGDIIFASDTRIPVRPPVLRTYIKAATGLNLSIADFLTVKDYTAFIGDAPPDDDAKPAAGPTADPKAKAAKPTAEDAKKAKADEAKKAKALAAQRKKLVTALSDLLKARAAQFRDNPKAAKAAKATKATLDKGDLDKAEKAIRALDTATRPAA